MPDMKILLCSFIAIVCLTGLKAQTVGIGTPKPDTSAVLDIASASKGVLIPRLADTAKVVKPLEGLVIYNKQTKTPFYYNGKQWLSLGTGLAGSGTSANDVITYQVTDGDCKAEEDTALAISQANTIEVTAGGVSGYGKLSVLPFRWAKPFDSNTKSFNRAAFTNKPLASVEFKLYRAGENTPYLSYRFKTVRITAYEIGAAQGGGMLTETISLLFTNYGVKDWATNVSFGFDVIKLKESDY